MKLPILLCSVFISSIALLDARSQTAVPHPRPLAPSIIVPHARPCHGVGLARITEVAASIEIVEQVATTTLDIALSNPAPSRLEAELIIPVPEGVALRGFA